MNRILLLALLLWPVVAIGLWRHGQRKLRSWRYHRMLRNRSWEQRKVVYYSRHAYACAKCGSTKGLSLHHLYYVWGRKPWQYPDSAYEPRCRRHHPQGAPFLRQ